MKRIRGAGKVVILDGGFCVLKALRALKTYSIFAAAVKKCWYWPRHIKGEEVNHHFVNAEVSHADVIAGYLDNVPFHIFAMKDTTFTGMYMLTYGTLEEMGNTTKRFYKTTT
jgi:hypothetical protein